MDSIPSELWFWVDTFTNDLCSRASLFKKLRNFLADFLDFCFDFRSLPFDDAKTFSNGTQPGTKTFKESHPFSSYLIFSNEECSSPSLTILLIASDSQVSILCHDSCSVRYSYSTRA